MERSFSACSGVDTRAYKTTFLISGVLIFVLGIRVAIGSLLHSGVFC
jgi:hypothetical protein